MLLVFGTHWHTTLHSAYVDEGYNVIYINFLTQTNATFQAKYKTYLKDFIASDLNLVNDTTIHVAYETITYDAVWAIATALNKTENVLREDGYSLADFEYSSVSQSAEVDDGINSMITKNFTSFMSETNFEGVSVSVCVYVCVCVCVGVYLRVE